MQLKVCGLTDINQIKELSNLEIDRLGFIFYKKSPRYVDEKLNKEELVKINSKANKTGVFVNEKIDCIKNVIKDFKLTSVQLHGNESPDFCKELKDNIEVIKTISIKNKESFIELEKYKDTCDYFLFDTYSEAYGGTGEKFDWSWLINYKLNIPFFLSGGIDLADIKDIQAINHPNLVGIDVNSKFEIAPGIKDLNKIKELIKLIK
ncbi:MAG: phosphoribosylanthranilate isomerase [Bacteroidetes bacterium]|nr:phosphoribosylanthranilate isomerase [Bacteroidota bacterium]